MKILFDQGVPAPLRNELPGHSIDTAFDCGWSDLDNGDLLDAAEANGYELILTTDQNLQYQQNLSERSIAILVLLSTAWPKIQLKADDVRTAVDAVNPHFSPATIARSASKAFTRNFLAGASGYCETLCLARGWLVRNAG